MMTKRSRLRSLIAIGGWSVLSATAAWAGYQLPAHARAARIATSDYDPHNNMCLGAVHGPFAVDVEPGQIVSDRGAESLRLRLVVNSRSKKDARVRHSVELLDDRGEAVGAPIISDPIGLKADAQAVRIGLPAIGALPDGFYQAKITVAGQSVDKSERSAEVLHFYWQHQGGKVVLMDEADWGAQSGANLETHGVAAPAVAPRAGAVRR